MKGIPVMCVLFLWCLSFVYDFCVWCTCDLYVFVV